MRYVAAYLLAALSKDAPSKGDVTKILESVGLDIDDERLDKVMSELKGKVLSEVIAEGMGKLASMPSGGAVAAGGGAAGGGAAAAAEKEEEKQEEKKEESEESDDDMGFGLFD